MNASLEREWETFGCEGARIGADASWRVYADGVNRRLIEAWLPTGLRCVLKTDLYDEAVGAGQARTLAQHAQQVLALDVAPSVVGLALRHHPALAGWAGDVRRLPLPDGCVDAVVSLSTLDHFERLDDIDTALAELRRVLVDDGQLIITLDNRGHPIVRLREWLPRRWLRRLGLVPYHCGPTLSIVGLCAALSRAGFAVEQRSAIVHCPRVLVIPVLRRLGSALSTHWQDRFQAALHALERLQHGPLRFRTGHFVAVSARARAKAPIDSDSESVSQPATRPGWLGHRSARPNRGGVLENSRPRVIVE